MSRCQIFSDDEIASFRTAGGILRECLEMLRDEARSGVSTKELDAMAEEFIRRKGGTPAFKGYQNFPWTICTSVNEQTVHGMPSDRTLKDGDIVSLDCGVIINGLYTDACITVPIGDVSADAQRIIKVSEEALKRAVSIIKADVKVGDISATIEQYTRAQHCYPIVGLTGHGLGYDLHQFPDIPNLGKAGSGAAIPAGAVIAVEPIVSLGTDRAHEGGDGWTIVTDDGSLSAHSEHTILVTEGGCEVLA